MPSVRGGKKEAKRDKEYNTVAYQSNFLIDE